MQTVMPTRLVATATAIREPWMLLDRATAATVGHPPMLMPVMAATPGRPVATLLEPAATAATVATPSTEATALTPMPSREASRGSSPAATMATWVIRWLTPAERTERLVQPAPI